MHDLFVKDPIKEWDDWSKRLVVHTRGIKSRIGESLYLASPMVLFLSNVFFSHFKIPVICLYSSYWNKFDLIKLRACSTTLRITGPYF